MPNVGCKPGLSPQAGIAIGPILFVLALLAIIGVVMSSGMGGFSQAGVIDRISADVSTQANLIRAKINECTTEYGTGCGTGVVTSGSCSNFDGYPSSVSSGSAVAIDIKTVACQGDQTGQQNIWTGARPTTLPPPTTGFNDWEYINTNTVGLGGSASGGRCIFITPTDPSAAQNAALVAGLTKAANKFTHNTSNDGASEVNYDPASTSQKFILWISVPTAGSEDTNCKP